MRSPWVFGMSDQLFKIIGILILALTKWKFCTLIEKLMEWPIPYQNMDVIMQPPFLGALWVVKENPEHELLPTPYLIVLCFFFLIFFILFIKNSRKIVFPTTPPMKKRKEKKKKKINQSHKVHMIRNHTITNSMHEMMFDKGCFGKYVRFLFTVYSLNNPMFTLYYMKL